MNKIQKGDKVSFNHGDGYSVEGKVNNIINGFAIVANRRTRFGGGDIYKVALEKLTFISRPGMVDPRQHSDKGLETLTEMGTKPENWGLTPIKWEKKIITIEAWVLCPDCRGAGLKRVINGKKIDYYQRQHEGTTVQCETCPRVKFTKAGRSYYYTVEGQEVHGECDGFRSYFDKTYTEDNGLVKAPVKVERWFGTVLWAKDTKFDSRFNHRHWEGNCELCAKAIPSRRFVPVNGKDEAGTIHGMWIGEDCARKFFGIKAFKPEQIIKKEAR